MNFEKKMKKFVENIYECDISNKTFLRDCAAKISSLLKQTGTFIKTPTNFKFMDLQEETGMNGTLKSQKRSQ